MENNKEIKFGTDKISAEQHEKLTNMSVKMVKFGCFPMIVIFILIWIFSPSEEPTFDLSNGEASVYGITKDLIKNQLKSPSTAKFGDVWDTKFYTNNEDSTITLQGYVDAQNSFGAMIRMNYTAKYKYTTGSISDRSSYNLIDLKTE